MANLTFEAIEWAFLGRDELIERSEDAHRFIREVMTIPSPQQAHKRAYQYMNDLQGLGTLLLYVSLNLNQRKILAARLYLDDAQTKQWNQLAFYFHYKPLFDAFSKAAPTLKPPQGFNHPGFLIEEQCRIHDVDLEHLLQKIHEWLSPDMLFDALESSPEWDRVCRNLFQSNPEILKVFDQLNVLELAKTTARRIKKPVVQTKENRSNALVVYFTQLPNPFKSTLPNSFMQSQPIKAPKGAQLFHFGSASTCVFQENATLSFYTFLKALFRRGLRYPCYIAIHYGPVHILKQGVIGDAIVDAQQLVALLKKNAVHFSKKPHAVYSDSLKAFLEGKGSELPDFIEGQAISEAMLRKAKEEKGRSGSKIQGLSSVRTQNRAKSRLEELINRRAQASKKQR